VATLNQQQHEVNEEDEDCDEKKFKEEIVLIGEKCDIGSLLDNQNKQLFNLRKITNGINGSYRLKHARKWLLRLPKK
jgi:hypothetical protein